MHLAKNTIAAPLSATAPAARGALRSGAAAATFALLAVILALGFALRLLAAQGDLWLDEITSLRLLRSVHALRDVFLGVHSDNNHFFNTAWLWFVGVDAPVLSMRAPAIALGTLSVLATWSVCRRVSEASGLIAALLFATGYFFVHYGSEARGYAGMILAIVVAYGALQAVLDDDRNSWAWAVFGAAVCAGTFFHLTMVEAAGALCLSAVGVIAVGADDLRRKLWRCAQICVVAGIATAPAVGCFVYGFLAGDFHAGWMEPFSLATILQGLSGVARATLGVPEALGNTAAVAVAALFALAMLPLLPARRRWFPAVAIFGLPLLHAAIGLPSETYPRFHLTVAVALPLLAGEGLGALWSRKGAARGVAVAVLAAILAGQAFHLASFFRMGRGQPTAALERMSAEGPATFATDEAWAPEENKTVALFTAQRAGVDATPVAKMDWCAAPPQWLISGALPSAAAPLPEAKTAGPADCATHFRRDQNYPAWGLSGFTWTLYRRADQSRR